MGTKTKKEKDHMNAVAGLGCIACNKLGFPGSPAQLHHIKNNTGVGRKSSHMKLYLYAITIIQVAKMLTTIAQKNLQKNLEANKIC